jgi:hypothetical protein
LEPLKSVPQTSSLVVAMADSWLTPPKPVVPTKTEDPGFWDQIIKKLQMMKLIPMDKPAPVGLNPEELAASLNGPMARRQSLVRTYAKDEGDQ